MKRYLYLWHRWLGIGCCLLMVLWFVSGMVMLYVGYPKLTPLERLAHLPGWTAARPAYRCGRPSPAAMERPRGASGWPA